MSQKYPCLRDVSISVPPESTGRLAPQLLILQTQGETGVLHAQSTIFAMLCTINLPVGWLAHGGFHRIKFRGPVQKMKCMSPLWHEVIMSLPVHSALPFIRQCHNCAIIHASHSISSTALTAPYPTPPCPRGSDPTRLVPTPSHATSPDTTRHEQIPPHPTGPGQPPPHPIKSPAIPRRPTPPQATRATPPYAIAPASSHHAIPPAPLAPRHPARVTQPHRTQGHATSRRHAPLNTTPRHSAPAHPLIPATPPPALNTFEHRPTG